MKKFLKILPLIIIYCIFDQTRAYSGIEVSQFELSFMYVLGKLIVFSIYCVLPIYLARNLFRKVRSLV